MSVTVNRKFDLVKIFPGKIIYHPDKGTKTKSQSFLKKSFNSQKQRQNRIFIFLDLERGRYQKEKEREDYYNKADTKTSFALTMYTFIS